MKAGGQTKVLVCSAAIRLRQQHSEEEDFPRGSCFRHAALHQEEAGPHLHSCESRSHSPFRFLLRFGDLLVILVSLQEIKNLEQFIDADYANFIHVQNVYENILQQTLDKEVAKGELEGMFCGGKPL